MPERIGPSLYVVEAPRMLRTPRVVQGVEVGYHDYIGKIGVKAESVNTYGSSFTEYIRTLNSSLSTDFATLAQMCRDGRFSSVLAFGDLSILAKSAGRFGFEVFNTFDSEDQKTADFYAQTTRRIGETQGSRHELWRGWQELGMKSGSVYEALISRDALMERW